MTDLLNEVMEQIRPLNDALTEKARVTHALRRLVEAVDVAIEWMGDGEDTRAWFALKNAVAEAKEALK